MFLTTYVTLNLWMQMETFYPGFSMGLVVGYSSGTGCPASWGFDCTCYFSGGTWNSFLLFTITACLTPGWRSSYPFRSNVRGAGVANYCPVVFMATFTTLDSVSWVLVWYCFFMVFYMFGYGSLVDPSSVQ